METLRSIAKIFAVALAALIVGSITMALVGSFWLVGNIFGVFDNWRTDEEVVVSEEVLEEEEVRELDIDLKMANLWIRPGAELKVEVRHETIKQWRDGEKLIIKDEGVRLGGDGEADVVIEVPEGMEFREVKISAGAGKMKIEGLRAKQVNLGLGAGKVEIDGLEAEDLAKIDGGAGMLDVKNGKMGRLVFDMGAGSAEIQAEIMRSADIEAGVGRLELGLVGGEDDYRVLFDQGIGKLELENIGLENSRGERVIDIDGGVGLVKVKRVEK